MNVCFSDFFPAACEISSRFGQLGTFLRRRWTEAFCLRLNTKHDVPECLGSVVSCPSIGPLSSPFSWLLLSGQRPETQQNSNFRAAVVTILLGGWKLSQIFTTSQLYLYGPITQIINSSQGASQSSQRTTPFNGRKLRKSSRGGIPLQDGPRVKIQHKQSEALILPSWCSSLWLIIR